MPRVEPASTKAPARTRRPYRQESLPLSRARGHRRRGYGDGVQGEDLKLGRRVALKFLPEELASDPVTLQRF